MKILITGRNGQLAKAFIERFERDLLDYVAPEESKLDITDPKTVSEAVRSCKPGVIINCAAYNLVDKAEQEPEVAFRVNAAGPQNLARSAEQIKAMFVHFGSDYVFNGGKENALYTEDDAADPLNEYGKSKLAGEEFARKECERCLILRLSWVFGSGKQNFIFKLKSWAQNSRFLKIACDEFSVPTWTNSVVEATLKAINDGATGRFHLTNTGYCSRYEWAKLVLSELGINKFIRPVSMDSFALPAPRPGFSAMSNERLSKALNISIPAWEDAVGNFLKEKGHSS
jgi:dTDP-4-dehydrorhamnose reductase